MILKHLKIAVLPLAYASTVLNAQEITKKQLLEDTYFIKLGIYSSINNIDKYKRIYKDEQLYIKPYRDSMKSVYLVNFPNKKVAKLKLKEVKNFIKDAYMAKITAKELCDDLVKTENIDKVLAQMIIPIDYEPATRADIVSEKLEIIQKPDNVVKKLEKVKKIAVKAVPKKSKKGWVDGLFVTLGAGYTSVNIENNVNRNILIQKAIDNKALLYELGLGYRFTPYLFTTLMMQQNELELVDIMNLTASVNYKYNNKYLQPYIGVVAGYSDLKWQSSPIKETVKASKRQKKIVHGVQVGSDYELENKVWVYLQYQFLLYDHKATVDDLSEIKHKNQSNFSTGLRYDF